MTNLPATIAAAESANDRAARLLQSTSAKLLVSRTEQGEWVLVPQPGLTPSNVRDGLFALDGMLAGGPQKRIATELMKLIAVTRQPSNMDDERSAIYFVAIQEAMMDYPIQVVEKALQDWRKGPQGEWWPAEAELRRMCDKQVMGQRALREHAKRLLEGMEREDALKKNPNAPSAFADSPAQEFRKRMRAKLGEKRFDLYFHAADVLYRGAHVYVRSRQQADVLDREGAEHLSELALEVIYAPHAFDLIPARPAQDVTEEERAEMTERLRRLALTMRGAAA